MIHRFVGQMADAARRRVCGIVWLALFACFAFPGCGPFWVDPYITVKESSLNWVIIHYYRIPTAEKGKPIKSIRRTTVEIYGNGLVVVKKGASELVSNDFAKHYKSDDWSKIHTSRIQIEPKAANDIFQHLVNFGVLDREKNFRKAKPKYDKNGKKIPIDRFIAVKANISTNTYSDNVNIFEEDPDLAVQLLDVVREFDTPNPR